MMASSEWVTACAKTVHLRVDSELDAPIDKINVTFNLGKDDE